MSVIIMAYFWLLSRMLKEESRGFQIQLSFEGKDVV